MLQRKIKKKKMHKSNKRLLKMLLLIKSSEKSVFTAEIAGHNQLSTEKNCKN